MRVCICDDILEYRMSIRTYVEQYFKTNIIDYNIDEYNSPNELLNSPHLNEYDIFLLDIEFGTSKNGLELAKQIKQASSRAYFIIVTAYNHYLDDAMDLGVLRFITKPIEQKRIYSALDRAIDVIYHSAIIIKSVTGETLCLDKQTIIFAEAKFKKSYINTVHGEYICSSPFKVIKQKLNYPDFIIPHNSYIVSFSSSGLVLHQESGNVFIPISATKQAIIKKQLSIWGQ